MKALIGTSQGSSIRAINEEKLNKKRERNAQEVQKLQNLFKDMIESRKRERSDRRGAPSPYRGRDFDPEDVDSLIQDHTERYKIHAQEDRIRRKSKRSGATSTVSTSPSFNDDGITDERAVYYMSQIRKKASLIANHLERTARFFSEEEVHDINQKIVDYIAMEKKVAAYIQKTADDFNHARDIYDRQKRLNYLERVKADRNARQPLEKAAREAARDHFLSIRAILDPYIHRKQEL
eukprot:scaffold2312_cov165-Ochromonas_danica.AAC.78